MFRRTTVRVEDVLNPTMESFDGLWSPIYKFNPVLACTWTLPFNKLILGSTLYNAVIEDCWPIAEASPETTENIVATEPVPEPATDADTIHVANHQQSPESQPSPKRRLKDGEQRPITLFNLQSVQVKDLDTLTHPFMPSIKQHAWKTMQLAHPPLQQILVRRLGAPLARDLRRGSGIRLLDLLIGFEVLRLHTDAEQWLTKGAGYVPNAVHEFEILLPLREEDGEVARMPDGSEAWRACGLRVKCYGRMRAVVPRMT